MTTPDKIEEIITKEIDGQWDKTNFHYVNLRKCLITPEKIKTVDTKEKEMDVWLVLVENPEMRLGYGIAYEELSGTFGLVQFAKGYEPCLIGLYGTFIETLDAM